MAELGGIKLTKFRVVDLRTELEKRGLDKTGFKAVLVERLEKSLREESRIIEADDRSITAENDIRSTNCDKTSLEMAEIVTMDETTNQSSVSKPLVGTEMFSLPPSSRCSCLNGALVAEIEGIKLEITILQKQMEAKADLHTYKSSIIEKTKK